MAVSILCLHTGGSLGQGPRNDLRGWPRTAKTSPIEMKGLGAGLALASSMKSVGLEGWAGLGPVEQVRNRRPGGARALPL